MISLIVARARNGAIGRNGAMPWQIPEDLAFFKRETLGGAIVMGRNTWDSLPTKPLAKRLNIVVSSNPETAEVVVPSVTAAVNLARDQGYQRVYGIGGTRIYEEMLPLAQRLLISEVEVEVQDADAFFPSFDAGNWEEIDERPLRLRDPACCLRELLKRP